VALCFFTGSAALLTLLPRPSRWQVVVTLSGYQNPARGELREAALALGGPLRLTLPVCLLLCRVVLDRRPY
jgi:hypothetical protein